MGTGTKERGPPSAPRTGTRLWSSRFPGCRSVLHNWMSRLAMCWMAAMGTTEAAAERSRGIPKSSDDPSTFEQLCVCRLEDGQGAGNGALGPGPEQEAMPRRLGLLQLRPLGAEGRRRGHSFAREHIGRPPGRGLLGRHGP
mmetsp:Transcript_93288/g.295918  ORF Transcript_93288/g.295918 Transcript_93288/m.295918 type:complete len:141 (-) Transcript_93288:7-429(-)